MCEETFVAEKLETEQAWDPVISSATMILSYDGAILDNEV